MNVQSFVRAATAVCLSFFALEAQPPVLPSSIAAQSRARPRAKTPSEIPLKIEGALAENKAQTVTPPESMNERAEQAANVFNAKMDRYKGNPKGFLEFMRSEIKSGSAQKINAKTVPQSQDVVSQSQMVSAQPATITVGSDVLTAWATYADDTLVFNKPTFTYDDDQNLRQVAASGFNNWVSFLLSQANASGNPVVDSNGVPITNATNIVVTAASDGSGFLALNSPVIGSNITFDSTLTLWDVRFSGANIVVAPPANTGVYSNAVGIGANSSAIELTNGSLFGLSIGDAGVTNLDARGMNLNYGVTGLTIGSGYSSNVFVKYANLASMKGATINSNSGYLDHCDVSEATIQSITGPKISFSNCAFIAPNITEKLIRVSKLYIDHSILIGTGFSDGTMQQLANPDLKNVTTIDGLAARFNSFQINNANGYIDDFTVDGPDSTMTMIAAKRIIDSPAIQAKLMATGELTAKNLKTLTDNYNAFTGNLAQTTWGPALLGFVSQWTAKPGQGGVPHASLQMEDPRLDEILRLQRRPGGQPRNQPFAVVQAG